MYKSLNVLLDQSVCLPNSDTLAEVKILRGFFQETLSCRNFCHRNDAIQ